MDYKTEMIFVKVHSGLTIISKSYCTLEEFINDRNFASKAFFIFINKKVKIKCAKALFADFFLLKEIQFHQDSFSECSDFSYMFKSCYLLDCDISICTKSAVRMNYMFSQCTKFNSKVFLTDTSKVVWAQGMFYNCLSLNKKLDFSLMNTKPDNKGKMFFNNKSMSINNRQFNYEQLGVYPAKLKNIIRLKCKREIFNKI